MKQYNGEKAIISLTSWKKRINTVHKTIANLIGICPGFHIVLCLSEEEFPKKEAELPKSLMRFVNADLIEILWVYKNYKSFKKVLFTMDKYRDVPVISADDDCIYIRNYAEELYQTWLKNKTKIITVKTCIHTFVFSHGAGTLYYNINNFINSALNLINNKNILNTNHDDVFYGLLFNKLRIDIIDIKLNNIYLFHDQIEALSSSTSKCKSVLTSIKMISPNISIKPSIDEDVTILTFNFNNNFITSSFIDIFLKKFPNMQSNILIIDNSTNNEQLFSYPNKNINIIDNRNYKLTKNFGIYITKNHAFSIDYALKNIIKTKYCLLCDNDIVVTEKIKELFLDKHNYDVIGEIGYNSWPPNRLFPYFCLIDVSSMKKNKINYFDENNIQILDKKTHRWLKDTGCSFYEECVRKKLKIKNIKLSNYIYHFNGGSHTSGKYVDKTKEYKLFLQKVC